MKHFILYKIIFLIIFLSCSSLIFAQDLSTSPTKIEAIILNNFTKNEVTKKISITVMVKDGIAFLLGGVATPLQAYTAVIIADSADGVNDVDISRLSIANGQLTYFQVVDATVIGTLIRLKVFGDNVDVNNFPIRVQTDYGITYLDGTVDYRNQLNKCVNISRRVKGVQRVISRLNVRYFWLG
jgi:osmotically-inducible protein OsmY